MQTAAQLNTNRKISDNKNMEPENGLVNLVRYYQNIFDREENILYYSPENYQNAKRKFVKYSLKSRPI
ncbi:MAG: hypothetical protein ACI8PB_003687 [Desulforhopalus sp.]|jgi:hypothetical protein